MKKKYKFFETLPGVALITALILLIPLVAMQFSTEVDWSAADFIIMGLLIFGTGSSYVLITRHMPQLVFKLAMAMAIGSTFFMIWANLAVGLIGSGAHAGNLMYIAVVAVVIIGMILSRLTSRGMELAMYSSTASILLLTLIALVSNMQAYLGSSVKEIISVNAFFATLYAISALLFRSNAQERHA